MSNCQHRDCSQDTVIIDIEKALHTEEVLQRINNLPELMGQLDGAASHSWNGQFNDTAVRTHFKVDRRQVLVEELLKDCMFMQNKEAFERWRNSQLTSTLWKKFGEVLTTVNVPDHEFADTLQNRRDWLLLAVESAQNKWVYGGNNVMPPPLAVSQIECYWFNQLTSNIVRWLTQLIDLLKKDVTETMETKYVDMFAALMICFSIDINDGRNARLRLGNSTCNPDLLLKSIKLNLMHDQPKDIWMPLEAKSASLDPELAEQFKEKNEKKKAERLAKEKEAKEKKDKGRHERQDDTENENQGDTENENQGDPAPGPSNEPHEDVIQVVYESEDDLISKSPGSASDNGDHSASPRSASDSGDQPTSPVPQASPIAGRSTEMSSGDDSHEIPRKKKRVFFSSWSGTTLHPSTKETIKAFFSQLLGSVIALQQENPSEKAIGIGVVGYKIVFLAYYGCDRDEKLMKLGDVPKTPGAKTLVQLTKPLCILNARDREEIALALLAMGGSPSYGEL